MSPLERRLRALLRWYPRAWRARHGDVMLATLLDDAQARGLARPRHGDAWSIRMHGLAERGTPATAAVLAGVGLLLHVAVTLQRMLAGSVVGSTQRVPGWPETASLGQIVVILLTSGIATPLVAIAIVALVRWRTGTSAGATVLAAGAICLASVVLVAEQVGTTFVPVVTEWAADGSVTSSMTGVTTAPVQLAAATVVAAGLLPLAHELVLRPRTPWLRWLVALPTAAALAAMGVLAASSALPAIAAVAVVLLALTAGAGERVARRMQARPRTWSSLLVGALSGASLLLAVPTLAILALASAGALDVSPAGLSRIGAVTVAGALPVVAATALVLRARIGDAAWLCAAPLAIGTLAAVVALLLDPARPVVQPILLVAAAFVALGIGLILLPLAPGATAMRVVVALAVAASVAALVSQSVPLLLGIAWVAAIPMLVVAIGRRRSRRAAVA